MKTYVTFGQNHVHRIGLKVFDKDCVAVVNGDRKRVFEIFGSKFSFEYSEREWKPEVMKYFPRGYIEVE